MCNHWANITKEWCAIDSFSKYTWVILIKNQKGTSIVNAFKKIISDGTEAESNGRKKPNKIWVDQGSEFYNNSIKEFWKINDIEMYSTYMLLLKDLLEHWKMLSIWQLFQKMIILMC